MSKWRQVLIWQVGHHPTTSDDRCGTAASADAALIEARILRPVKVIHTADSYSRSTATMLSSWLDVPAMRIETQETNIGLPDAVATEVTRLPPYASLICLLTDAELSRRVVARVLGLGDEGAAIIDPIADGRWSRLTYVAGTWRLLEHNAITLADLNAVDETDFDL